MNKSDFVRGAAAGLVCAAAGAVIAIPILLWGSNKAPDFFGAFTAAIVAAVAVILGAYYQSELTRKRDDRIRLDEQMAEATDLCYWLDHAANEMSFIADVLLGIGQHLARDHQPDLDWPLERYREVVSAAFMNELLSRAKSASRLPEDLAAESCRALYRSFSVVDRVHRLRGIPDAFRATADHVGKHEEIARLEANRLRAVHELLFDRIAHWKTRLPAY